MCWTTLEVITALKDGILAIAGATTAIVAVAGLKTWSRQLRGTANFEVARSLAKATYRLRDEIRGCRTPLISASEFPDGRSPSGATPNEQDDAYRHVFSARLQPVYAALQEFDVQTLEAEALWGAAIREKTDELRAQVRKLNAAIGAYLSNLASGGEDFGSDRALGVQIRAEVFAPATSQDNALSMAMDNAIRGIEAELRLHLNRKL